MEAFLLIRASRVDGKLGKATAIAMKSELNLLDAIEIGRERSLEEREQNE